MYLSQQTEDYNEDKNGKTSTGCHVCANNPLQLENAFISCVIGL